MQLDIAANHAPPYALPDARGPPLSSIASCVSYVENPDLISSKLAGHGGARPNSGGARENSGGARAGAGRPYKVIPIRMPTGRFLWYVARAVHTQTDVAESDIWAAGFEIFSPQIFRPAVPAHRDFAGVFVHARGERFDPLFVRYVIVSLDLTDPSWREIPNMDSVERIISGGHSSNNGIGIPIAVRDAEIEGLRKELSPDGCLYPKGYRVAPNGRYYPRHYRAAPDGRFYPPSHFKRGEPINAGTSLRIPDGPEGNSTGMCEKSDGERVVMLMNWFNRDGVPTHVKQSAVEAAEPI